MDESQTLKHFLNISIPVIIAIINLVEIILIIRLKRKKTFQTVLLSLSVSDLLFGLSSATVYIVLSFGLSGGGVLNITIAFTFFFVLTSIFHLLFIALDTLYAIVKPILHKVHMTKKKNYMILAAIWLVSIAIALGIYLAVRNGFDGYDLKHNGNFSMNITELKHPDVKPYNNIVDIDIYIVMRNLLSYVIIGADALLVICYAVIIYTVKFRKVKSNKNKTQNKIRIVCVFIMLLFVAFTLPYAIETLSSSEPWFEFDLIIISNSGMNSIIYFFRNKCGKHSK